MKFASATKLNRKSGGTSGRPCRSVGARFSRDVGFPVFDLQVSRPLGADVVANISAADPEDYVFRDVGRVVADPLQVAGDHQRVQRLRSVMGLLFDQNWKAQKRQCR